jgi:hypothetical protein
MKDNYKQRELGKLCHLYSLYNPDRDSNSSKGIGHADKLIFFCRKYFYGNSLENASKISGLISARKSVPEILEIMDKTSLENKVKQSHCEEPKASKEEILAMCQEAISMCTGQ